MYHLIQSYIDQGYTAGEALYLKYSSLRASWVDAHETRCLLSRGGYAAQPDSIRVWHPVSNTYILRTVTKDYFAFWVDDNGDSHSVDWNFDKKAHFEWCIQNGGRQEFVERGRTQDEADVINTELTQYVNDLEQQLKHLEQEFGIVGWLPNTYMPVLQGGETLVEADMSLNNS